VAIKHEKHIDQLCGCIEPEHTDCTENLYGNTCMAYVLSGSITVAADTLDYIMCPSASPFDEMSLWEFLEQMEKVKRGATENAHQQSDEEISVEMVGTEHQAYTRRIRCLFSDESHPQYNTHELCLRNKAMVPVLVGDLIPLLHYSDSWLEKFLQAMLLLFWPWWRVSSLLDGFTCWTEAFDMYEFKDQLSSLIDNFTVELECKDLRDFHQMEYLSCKQVPASALVSMPLGSNFADLELLHEALDEDENLDNARCLLDEFESDVIDQMSAMSEVSDNEKEILTLTKALWDVPSTTQYFSGF